MFLTTIFKKNEKPFKNRDLSAIVNLSLGGFFCYTKKKYKCLNIMSNCIYEKSMAYHQSKPYGKLAITPTKPMIGQEDLALAYSPGVAEPCNVIKNDPLQAAYLTARGNLIGVITNGSAILGLGNLGALAAKPVMEGKAVLFKKFANIDAFDIEINQSDPDKFIDIVESLEPTFGGINLEDIKAPECFHIEQELQRRLKIPVFHDDQHGTAIIVAAAVKNALFLVKKDIKDVKIVCSGAGAAAISCLDILVKIGANPDHILTLDSKGVLNTKNNDRYDASKQRYARDTNIQTLRDAVKDADILIGLSVANIMDEDMIRSMNDNPLIFALSNPEPEVRPELVKSVRDDAIMATGRTDYPNQVNNALCFPYIFRGALDVGAEAVNDAMKIACVNAIADLARTEMTDTVASAYGGEMHTFGRDYIIPKPFDKRLFVEVSVAVARAAMESGVAQRPIPDLQSYRNELEDFVFRSATVMRPIFHQVRKSKDLKRIAFSDGEESRILQAAQQLCDDNVCRPILIGRPDVIQYRINALGLRLQQDIDYDVTDPNKDDRFTTYWSTYYDLMSRKGVNPDTAKQTVRTNTTVIGGLMLKLGDADGLICGAMGRYVENFVTLKKMLGLKDGACISASLCALVLDRGPLFFCDPYINVSPSPKELVEITRMAAEQVKKFGVIPKAALVSHSTFGTSKVKNVRDTRAAIQLIKDAMPDLEIDGEMQAHFALNPEERKITCPHATLDGPANLLIFPDIDSANITYNTVRSLNDSQVIGPMLMGLSHVAHIATPTTTVRGLVNLASLAVLETQNS